MIRAVVAAGSREQGAGALLRSGDVWGLLESAGQWGAQQQPFANLCGVFQHFNSHCNATAGWQTSCTVLSCSAPSRLADPKPASPFSLWASLAPHLIACCPLCGQQWFHSIHSPTLLPERFFSNEKTGMKEVLLTVSVRLVPSRRGSCFPLPYRPCTQQLGSLCRPRCLQYSAASSPRVGGHPGGAATLVPGADGWLPRGPCHQPVFLLGGWAGSVCPRAPAAARPTVSQELGLGVRDSPSLSRQCGMVGSHCVGVSTPSCVPGHPLLIILL